MKRILKELWNSLIALRIKIKLTISKFTYRLILILSLILIQTTRISVHAQQVIAKTDTTKYVPQAKKHRLGMDELPAGASTADSLDFINRKSMTQVVSPIKIDSTVVNNKKKFTFVPNSGRATWLAAVIPGGGQIYNRKYWKLPIIYGGFVGCAYALSWNSKYYKDYSKAYLDIMDKDDKTNSYMNFLPPGTNINGQLDFYQKVFKQKKDSFRRNRDLSVFAFIGVYLISIIDAYVDAELSNFDISPDISMRIEPAVINDRHLPNTYGVQCSIKF